MTSRDDMEAAVAVDEAATRRAARHDRMDYECVYCGHPCTKVAHIDPERDTHRVMPVRAAVSANGATARRLMAAIATEEEASGQ